MYARRTSTFLSNVPHDDPGRLLVVLVIRHCVNVTKAKMEMARLVKEDGLEVDASVGCKAADSLLTLVTMYTHPRTQMWMATFVEEDGASMVPLNPLLLYDVFTRRETA